jgi:hypothetical protein
MFWGLHEYSCDQKGTNDKHTALLNILKKYLLSNGYLVSAASRDFRPAKKSLILWQAYMMLGKELLDYLNHGFPRFGFIFMFYDVHCILSSAGQYDIKRLRTPTERWGIEN